MLWILESLENFSFYTEKSRFKSVILYILGSEEAMLKTVFLNSLPLRFLGRQDLLLNLTRRRMFAKKFPRLGSL